MQSPVQVLCVSISGSNAPQAKDKKTETDICFLVPAILAGVYIVYQEPLRLGEEDWNGTGTHGTVSGLEHCPLCMGTPGTAGEGARSSGGRAAFYFSNTRKHLRCIAVRGGKKKPKINMK